MKNIEAAHPLITRHDVGGGVTFRMTDVQAGAAWIRKHVEHVELRFGRIEISLAWVERVEKLAFVPNRLPLRLDLIEWIGFASLAHEEELDRINKIRRIKTKFL